MENNNKRKINVHERLARIETNVKHIDQRLGEVEKLLDAVRMQISNWSGRFAIVSAVIGAITAGVVSLIVWLLVR